jgi:bacteriorhodopsin
MSTTSHSGSVSTPDCRQYLVTAPAILALLCGLPAGTLRVWSPMFIGQITGLIIICWGVVGFFLQLLDAPRWAFWIIAVAVIISLIADRYTEHYLRARYTKQPPSDIWA